MSKAPHHFTVGYQRLALLACLALYSTGCSKPAEEAGGGFAGYVGSGTCQECHPHQYALWANSSHARAERQILDTDQHAFSPPRLIEHASQQSQVHISNGVMYVSTMGRMTNQQPFPVERVIGYSPLQQFLSSAPGGRWQVHELAYASSENKWFDIYGNEDRRAGEYGHWTGRGMNWNAQCAFCHNTRVHKNYDPATDTYKTALAEQAVGCESCHGPLRNHNEWRQKHRGNNMAEPNPPRLSRSLSMEMCGTCHARRTELTGNFPPGDSFFDHFSLEILGETSRWHADGQVNDEVYEYASFMGTRMHQAGVTCRDCHRADSGTGDTLCMRCHSGGNPKFPTAPTISPSTHTFHKPGQPGSACVDCHMPTSVFMQCDARHDHSYPIPDPLLTKELGIPNACTQCHTNQPVQWTISYVDKWYGKRMDRYHRERTRVVAAGLRGDPYAIEGLLSLLQNAKEPPYWRAVAASLLGRVSPNQPIKSGLIRALNDSHPLPREKAAKALEPSLQIQDFEVISALTRKLDDESRSVRIAAAWVLRGSIDPNSRAGRELLEYLRQSADQPSGQFRLAVYYFARRNLTMAIEHLDKAIAWDPFSPVFPEVRSQMLEISESAKNGGSESSN